MRMNCMNCDHHLICRNADDDKNHVCSMYDPIFNRTNADRIRAMSDKELATWISTFPGGAKAVQVYEWLTEEVE